MDESREPATSAVPDPPVQYSSWTSKRVGLREDPLFHLGLFLLTFLSMTVMGAVTFSSSTQVLAIFLDGLRFSVPAVLILGSHEMGHYLMCRRYGIPATKPYFLPLPFAFGTLGAVIRIKEPITRRSQLLDVGAAGPLTGFLVAIPFLVYGIPRAVAVGAGEPPGEILYSYPLAVRIAQAWRGVHYTSATVHENPTFMAAWFGLLVTALNLVPIGQLDGGHVLRALVGRRQPLISRMVLGFAIGAALWGGYSWALFSTLAAVFLGLDHPPAEDEDAPLGFTRTAVGLICLIVFALCATLIPVGPEWPHLF